MKIKSIIVTLIIALLSLSLISCSLGGSAAAVQKAELDAKGNLILTFDDGTTQTLTTFKAILKAEVDADSHLILTYTDGTTEDKGVVSPKKCTVTFKDYDGRILAVTETYAGLSVNAPADPEREDHLFTGWDKDLTAVTGDMTVTAQYTAKQTFTVTFKDYDGKTLKTETVVSGKNATPPRRSHPRGIQFRRLAGRLYRGHGKPRDRRCLYRKGLLYRDLPRL